MSKKSKRIDKRQNKADTGIAIISAPMSDGSVVNFRMRESLRDALNKRGHAHPTERITPEPDYANMTKQELNKIQYSGFWLNKLAGTFEIWVLGKVAASERADKIAKNPGLIADMHEKAFSTTGSIVEVDIKTEMEKLKEIN